MEVPELGVGGGQSSKAVARQLLKEAAETAEKALNKISSNSAASLIESLGLAENGETSLHSMLKAMQAQVMSALGELMVITLHDDNIERQYNEVVAENRKLQGEVVRTRNELRHLKGQLSVIQMTSTEMREAKARTQLRERKRLDQERLIELQRAEGAVSEQSLYIPTAAERARTVNSKGQYVDYRRGHKRSSTYPMPHLSSPPKRASPRGHRRDTLPPPLIDCSCSECNSKQSLGALTLGKGLCQRHLTNQLTKSGQQILLGDKVIVKGERLGRVSYIGKLDFDVFSQIYIGVSLDMPVGNSDGSLKGRRYFQCRSSHGVFVKPGDVICVTGRKPLSGGTAIPRVREKLPMAILKWQNKQMAGGDAIGRHSLSPASASSRSESAALRAKARTIAQSELEALKNKEPYDLVDGNVAEMTERIKVLAMKQNLTKSKGDPATTTTTEIEGGAPTLSPQGIPPQPLPPIPGTPLFATPPGTGSTPRPATPLERTLLELLSDADLGATGFLKPNELKAVLMQLGKLSAEGVANLLTQVGVDVDDDAMGLPYHQLLPHLLPPLLEQC